MGSQHPHVCCLLWKGFVLEHGEQSSQVTSTWISLACFKMPVPLLGLRCLVTGWKVMVGRCCWQLRVPSALENREGGKLVD